MIPANWAVWMLAGIECGKIEPDSPAGDVLMESLPDQFWDQLESARDDEEIIAAYTWGRKWMIAYWTDLLRYCPPDLWRAAGPTPPSSPAPQAETVTTPREEAGPGIPVEDAVPAEPDPGSESVDAARERAIRQVVRMAEHVTKAVLSSPQGPVSHLWLHAVRSHSKNLQDALIDLAEFEPPETPEQMGWVDGRGLP